MHYITVTLFHQLDCITFCIITDHRHYYRDWRLRFIERYTLISKLRKSLDDDDIVHSLKLCVDAKDSVSALNALRSLEKVVTSGKPKLTFGHQHLANMTICGRCRCNGKHESEIFRVERS